MATKKKAEDTPVYDKATLIEAAETFGTTPEIMAGALYYMTEPLTQDHARKKLEAFLVRPIKE